MFWSLTFVVFIVFGVKNCFAIFPATQITDDLDFIGENQVYFNRKERFIKFDTKDNELEIELGISIPFIKIPLNVAAKQNEETGQPEEQVISVNGPGLVVAGVLMVTSFLVIPLFFMKKPYGYEGFGFARIGKKTRDFVLNEEKECSDYSGNKVVKTNYELAGEDNNFWRIVKEVEEVMVHNQIDSSTCGQKAVCWIAKTSKGGKDGSIGKWIDGMLSTWWVHRLINGTFVNDAVSAGQGNETCSVKFPQCPLNQDHLKLAATTFMSGFKKR